MGEKRAAPMVENIDCDICFETKKSLVQACKVCNGGICIDCIRHLFISACKDQAAMPARCCAPINIGIAASFLTTEEIELYSLRYEEQHASNPVYCPVPTCSTFISPRLFGAESQTNTNHLKNLFKRDGSILTYDSDDEREETKEKQEGENSQSIPASHNSQTLQDANQIQNEALEQQKSISCPACSVQICCGCKQLAHPDSPCGLNAGDIDPEFAALLTKLHIKRCPKCRTGIRRMYGCNHIVCRCGFNFCWACARPILICHDCDPDGCDGDEDEDGSEYDESDFEDLDDVASNSESTAALDFGIDPNNVNSRLATECAQSGVGHTWERGARYEEGTGKPGGMECERCRARVSALDIVYPEVADLLEHGHIPERPSSGAQTMDYSICTVCYYLVCEKCNEAILNEEIINKDKE